MRLQAAAHVWLQVAREDHIQWSKISFLQIMAGGLKLRGKPGKGWLE